MRCRKAQRLINELLDGELREKDRKRLQTHLDCCADCRQVYEDLKAIKTEVVPADSLEPSDRVWENLKSRLQAEVIPKLQVESAGPVKEQSRMKISRWFQIPMATFKYATAIFIFLVFIAGAFYLGQHYQKPVQPELQVASENTALKKIQEAELYYRKAIESLTQALQASDNGLPPEMTEVLQANLILLDRTIDLCQQAVNAQPDNLQARDYLLSAYNSKLNFLNNMLETKKSLATTGA